MSKVTPIQDDFSGGEFGPLSDGKVTGEKHPTALDECYNYIPTIEGPLVRRPGTRYVTEVKDRTLHH